MPELPEVETIVCATRELLVGSKVQSAEFFRKDIRSPIPIQKIRKNIIGQTISSVERRSKFMLVNTDEGSLIFHFGMTGVLKILDRKEPAVSHTHAVFAVLSPNEKSVHFVHFTDPRRFGQIDFLGPSSAEKARYFANLGPEPLDPKLDLAQHLFERSRKKKAPIKSFLMDGRNVVGVGNIYASESLFLVGLNPEVPCGKLDHGMFAKIAASVIKVLRDAIRAGGTTFRDFRSIDGSAGYFRTKLNVYGRVGEPCHACNDTIQSIVIGGRSTFFCPSCQSR